MSNIIVNRIRSADLPPTDKFVLWVISDIANDAGFTAAFAPLARLQAETRFSRQTIISAIQRLESQNIIKVDRLNGRQSSYSVNPNYRSDAPKPVNQLDGYNSYTSLNDSVTSLTGIPDQSNWHTQPVKQVDPIPLVHHIHDIPQCSEPEIVKTDKPKKAKFDPLAIDLPANVNQKLWAEFVTMRKEIKKPVSTERAANGLINQLTRLPEPNASLQQSIDNCWQGVFAIKAGSAYTQPLPSPKPLPQSQTPREPVRSYMENQTPVEERIAFANALKAKLASGE